MEALNLTVHVIHLHRVRENICRGLGHPPLLLQAKNRVTNPATQQLHRERNNEATTL